jgi:hypothetical protein
MRRFGTFIEFDVTPEQLARAEKWFSFKELKDSITNGDGNLAGALGEVVFMDYLSNTGRVADYVGTHGHDLTFGGYTMEIKTKRSNYAPKPNHNATVAVTSRHQNPDVYVFAQCLYDYAKLWLCGWMFREDFYEQSIFYEAGEHDVNAPSFVYSRASNNILLKHLNHFIH